MIQDIDPHILHNEYRPSTAKSDDMICIYSDDSILISLRQGNIELPRLNQVLAWIPVPDAQLIFLFSIDATNYYLLPDSTLAKPDGWEYMDMMKLRSLEESSHMYASALGGQLNRWYKKNRYCGCCGHPLKLHTRERALFCESCSQIVYPNLSPSVIVAITDNDRILMTKYAKRTYTRYALVAGYAEVGETLEDTVRREVLEEVGLKVKHIRYYKSQPWPFTDTLLVGYFAELDGDDTITLEEQELSEATWFERHHIPATASVLSLTNEMIEAFRHGIAF